jgi:capsular polysaccharide biosynthesis protein
VFHDDPDGATLFSGWKSATVVYPPAFVASARDSVLAGSRVIITADDRFFTDSAMSSSYVKRFLQTFAAKHPESGGLGLLPAEDEGQLLYAGDKKQEHVVNGSTILLTSLEPANYGSFLFRVLPKLHAIKQLNLHEARFLAYVSNPLFLEYLRCAGIDTSQVIPHLPRNAYHFDRLFVPSIRNHQGFLDMETLELFADIRGRLGTTQNKQRRIYVSRLAHSARRKHGRIMLNEAELISALRARDFEIVEPETRAPLEQIRIFTSAGMVVGPSGSAMFNVVFSHPGTKIIDIESERDWIWAHTNLFSSCGHAYGIFEGKIEDISAPAPHRPWRVNIPALLRRIDLFHSNAVS